MAELGVLVMTVEFVRASAQRFSPIITPSQFRPPGWIHLGFAANTQERSMLLTPDTARRCESIVPQAVAVSSLRTACSQWPESIPHPSACILTEGEFVGSAWPTYLGPYPGFQLPLLRFQLRQTFAAQMLSSLLFKHTL
jgi:hypothetical protein